MLIFLCGPSFVGKRTIARYLQQEEKFQILHLTNWKETSRLDNDEFSADMDMRFNGIEDLEKYVMSDNHWRMNWVLLGTLSLDQFQQLQTRPFFLSVAVDAPLSLRCKRANADFFKLAEKLDSEKYPPSPLAELMARAQVIIVNDATDLPSLYSVLDKLRLGDPERIRPSWDTYFMQLCHLTANRSNCMKRKVGAILTSERRILATGYNGTPFSTLNCNEGGCPRCNLNSRAGTHLDTCFCLHAEENTLLNSEKRAQMTLYCTMFPCIQCAKKIVQCKIERIVYHRSYAQNDPLVHSFLKQSGVHIDMHQEKQNVVFSSLSSAGM